MASDSEVMCRAGRAVRVSVAQEGGARGSCHIVLAALPPRLGRCRRFA